MKTSSNDFSLLTETYGFGREWSPYTNISYDQFYTFTEDDIEDEIYFQRIQNFHFMIRKVKSSQNTLTPAFIYNKSSTPIFIANRYRALSNISLGESRILLDNDIISVSPRSKGRLFKFSYLKSVAPNISEFERIEKEYFVGSCIESGGQANIHIMWAPEIIDGKMNRLALKIIPKSPDMPQEAQNRLMREVQAMKQLNHPNIIKLVDYNDTLKNLLIISPYMSGGNLISRIVTYYENPFMSEDIAKFYFRQLLNGLDYMHKKKWIHRDSKTN